LYRIAHRGVPIGEADLDLEADPAVGHVATLPAYDSLRERVRIATRVLQASIAGSSTSDEDVLKSAVALGRELELRDQQGELIPTDFVELADWETDPLGVTVWVRLRQTTGGKPARRSLSERISGEWLEPDKST
jgi:hypothetical protein